MAKQATGTQTQAAPAPAPPAAATAPKTGEWEYVGDDGLRFVFQRRSDGIVATVEKPRCAITFQMRPIAVNFVVQGRSLRPEVRVLCRK